MRVPTNLRGLVLLAACALALLFLFNGYTFAQEPPTPTLTPRVYLPLLLADECGFDSGETYASLSVNPPPTDRPAAEHADLNLALRGYAPTNESLGLVDYGGATDQKSPQLDGLFADHRLPVITVVDRVNSWDWATNSRGAPITNPPVTLLEAQIGADETLRVPGSGYNIGSLARVPAEGFFADAPNDDPNGLEVLVLYAADERLTLKYTREDNVVRGYTLHLENVCVASELLALYEQRDAEGRAQLPALRAEQVFARARTDTLGIVIRDNGAFMDPRSRKDWWRGH